MREHDLKCHTKAFEALLNGTKRFELRKDDRGFAVGDWLILWEWNGSANTGRILRAKVTYITDIDAWVGRNATGNWVVLSLDLPCPACGGTRIGVAAMGTPCSVCVV